MAEARTKQGKDGKALQHPCKSIFVHQLRVGDEIGVAFGEGKYGEKVILKSRKVERIDECPGQWRTHIHVNKTDCYDERQKVTVKV